MKVGSLEKMPWGQGFWEETGKEIRGQNLQNSVK